MRAAFALFAAAFLCMPVAVHAAAKREARTAETAQVTAIKSDGTLELSSGTAATIGNVIWPDIALAESWLAANLLQQKVSYVAGEEDRYGRSIIASDATVDALREGAAMLYAVEGDVPAAWHTAEASARAAKRGVWANETLVTDVGETPEAMGAFRVVEGAITRIYEGKSATYLNFAEDWHTDFSITIPGKVRRSMKAELAALDAGSRVRVRGYIHDENGPMITLTHAANLERY